MELSTARDLLKPAIASSDFQAWYDLGCGSGLFTQALASLLSRGTITAVDKDKNVLKVIPSTMGEIKITKVAADFSELSFEGLDLSGILMANALHFVKDKVSFLKKLKA